MIKSEGYNNAKLAYPFDIYYSTAIIITLDGIYLLGTNKYYSL